MPKNRLKVIFLIPVILVLTLALRPQVSSVFTPGVSGKFLNGVFGEQIIPWQSVEAFSQRLSLPLWVIPKWDSTGYIYTSRTGQIWEIDDSRSNPNPRKILDIQEQVFFGGDGGLMDLAYHPEFGEESSPNGKYIYVNYIYLPPELKDQNPDKLAYHRISRFTFLDDGSIDRNSEWVFVQMFDRDFLHTGGSMFFDNEGFLNVSLGDEGKYNDLFENANTLEKRLYAGIIRIDVDMDTSRSHAPRRKPISVNRPEGWPEDYYENYLIPDSNPWQSPEGEFLEEFVIIGLRNPHTTYYDREKDEIWVADVGEAAREEISLMKRGDNGQWPYMEGTIPGPKGRPSNVFGNERPPIHDYGRDVGRSVIGGFVYRGEHERLHEKFIFGDFSTRNVWALDPGNGTVEFLTNTSVVFDPFGPVSFVNGVNNEIFLVNNGTRSILELLPNTDISDELAPKKLSEVGAFEELVTLTPAGGVMPYSLNSELYSDGALKRRWVAIPNDGEFDTLGEQASVNEQGALAFPRGTVFIKHFELPFDMRNPEITRKLETRFLVMTDNLDAYGVTYRWNDEGTKAELLEEGAEAAYEVINEEGELTTVNWVFPSRQQCMTCHNANAGYVLGPNMRNLNKGIHYSEEAPLTNQLRTWQNLGIIEEGLELSLFDPLSSLDNAFSSNESKVRSYLQSNCSFCHQPGGVETNFNALFTSSLDSANIVGAVVVGRQSLEENAVISPGDIQHSEMVRRIESLDGLRMPPLGTSLIDQEFAAILKEWILELGNVTSTISEGPGNERYWIYPNPTSGNTLHIRTTQPNSKHTFSVFDLSGSAIQVFENVSIEHPFYLELGRGVYFIKITDGIETATLKWVKK